MKHLPTSSPGRICTAVLLLWGLGLAPGVSARAQSAATLNKRGLAAETRHDFDTFYQDALEAYRKQPGDLRYQTRYERAKFQAAVMHVDRGLVLRQSGDTAGALAEFQRAFAIDPANETAAQEIQKIQGVAPVPALPGPLPPPQPGQTGQPAPPAAAANPPAGAAAAPERNTQVAPSGSELTDVGSVAGPIVLQPVSSDPITIHAVSSVRDIYKAIGKVAGLNVLFDPEYEASKRIPIDLTNVTLSDALRIVGTLAGTFYKPVTANTIFVAQNSRTKRAELDELAVQTFYLTNAAQQNDANEILTAVRNILDPSVKMYLVPSQNAIVMRATPDQLLLMQKMLNDLDRAKPEVVVDVAVLEVSRDKVRKLGITLPTSFGLTPTATTSTTTTGSTSNTTNSGGVATGTQSTTSGLTLSNLAHLNSNNFSVTVGGGTVNALLTDAATRVLQNPRIRATDGQRATLKIGSKIPIATGSLNTGGVGGVGGLGLGVQTSFTYTDVGVNIDMTPIVHYDHDVTLKLKIEVSQQNGSVIISNVEEPIISQRVIEQVIQLKDGEPSILAGLLQNQETKNVNGTPGLGEIPFFKFFFSTQSKEVLQDEIVFLLIPHIVRESVLTRLNTRAIDTGTSQGVELRHDSSLEPELPQPVAPAHPAQSHAPSAANAANAMIGQMSQAAQMPVPGTVPPGYAPGPGQPAAPGVAPQAASAAANWKPIDLTLVPPTSAQPVGSTFQVAVMLTGAHDVYSVPMQLKFNPSVLQLVNVDSGDLLSRDGQAVSIVHRDEGNGLVTISTSRPPGVAGVNGQGAVAVLTFKATGAGESPLQLVKVGAKSSTQASIPTVGGSAVVHVK